MLRQTRWLLSLVMLLSSVLFAWAVAEPKRPAAQAAATPEEAVQFVSDAHKAGDPHALLAQVAEPNRTEMHGQLQMMVAYHALEDALDKKFGKDPKTRFPRESVKEQMRLTKRVIVVGKKPLSKDKVQLTVWETRHSPFTNKDRITEKTWTAIKTAKGWKLLMPIMGVSSRKAVTRKGPDGKEVEVRVENAYQDESDPKTVAYMEKVMPKYLAALTKTKQAIQEGKYTSRKEARDALRKAEESLRKEYPPPERKRENKPAVDKAEPAEKKPVKDKP